MVKAEKVSKSKGSKKKDKKHSTSEVPDIYSNRQIENIMNDEWIRQASTDWKDPASRSQNRPSLVGSGENQFYNTSKNMKIISPTSINSGLNRTQKVLMAKSPAPGDKPTEQSGSNDETQSLGMSARALGSKFTTFIEAIDNTTALNQANGEKKDIENMQKIQKQNKMLKNAIQEFIEQSKINNTTSTESLSILGIVDDRTLNK